MLCRSGLLFPNKMHQQVKSLTQVWSAKKKIEYVPEECPLYPGERGPLNKGFLELDPRIFLDTKKGLRAVAKF